MCGRFVDPDLRSAGLDTSWLKINPFPQRFNVKPTQDILVVMAGGAGRYARWWLIPGFFKGETKDWKATTFNARIEDARDKPSFRSAWRKGRCLIPVAGYYEWTGDKAPKQPHFISDAGGAPALWFAGLSSPWQDGLTCTIVTRAANNSSSAVHTRMPVCLNQADRQAWMAGTDDQEIGANYEVRHWPVARFGAGDEGPEMIEAAA